MTTAVITASGRRTLTRAERSERTSELMAELAECADAHRREQLLEETILINRGVAEAVAARYRSRGVAQDDLNQVAYEGLVKAVTRFDPALRNDLLTYAVPTIRGELQRYFRDQGWTVRPPRRVQELQLRVNRTIEALSQQLGHEPDAAEVIAELEITEREYDEALVAFGCFQPTSLDQPVDQRLGDHPRRPDPGHRDETAALEARVRLAPVVRRLPERDRRILHLRFFEDRTQEEIGMDLGVTQMQVSRLLARILRQLREDLD